MTTQLQLRRDTTANIATITPAQGEPLYDVTRHALVLGDGATAGGACVTPFAGSWTPQLQFGGGNAGMSATINSATWVQIGPLVFAAFNLQLTVKGSATGAATITGLPVAAAGGGINGAVPIAYHAALATSPVFECYVPNGASLIALGRSGGASWAALADTDFTNTTQLVGCALYQAAQPTG